MKHIYIWLAIMISFGVLVGFIIIPSENEEALMYYKDKAYKKAFAKYHYLFSQGKVTQNTIIPLAKLYTIKGEPEKALILLENFAKKNPGLVGVYRELGELYKSVQRPVAYLENLEKICYFNPDKASVNELIKLLEENGKEWQWASFIEQLIRSDKYIVTNKQFLDLMNYYVYEKKIVRLNWLIDNIMTRDGVITNYMFPNLIKKLLHLEMDDKIVDVIVWFLKDRNEKDSLRFEVAKILLEEGKDELLASIEERLGSIDVSQLEYEMQIDFYLDERENERAYLLLYNRFKDSAEVLDHRMINELVKLSLSYGSFKSLKSVIYKIDVQLLSDDVLLEIAEKSMLLKNRELATVISDKLGTTFMQYNTLVSHFYDCAKRGDSLDYAVEKGVKLKLALDQNVDLMMVALLNRQASNVAIFFDKVGFLKLFKHMDIDDIANVIIFNGNYNNYIDRFKAKDEISKRERVLLFYLASGSGRDDIVESLFVNDDLMKKNILLGAFRLAADFKQYSIALSLARKLNGTLRVGGSKIILAEAYLLNKMYDDAVIITKDMVKSWRGKKLFIEALTGAALEGGVKRIAKYREKGDAQVKEILSNTSMSMRQRSCAILYLIATGENEQAINFFLILANETNYDSENVKYLFDIAMMLRSSRVIDWFLMRAESLNDVASKRELFNCLNELGEYSKVLELIGDEGKMKFPVAYLNALKMSGRNVRFVTVIKEIVSIDITQFSVWQRIKFVSLLYDEGELKEAYSIYKTIPVQERDDDLRAMEIADMFVANNDYQRALELYPSLKNRDKKALIHLMLKGASGELVCVKECMERYSGIKMADVVDLFTISEKYGHSKLCLKLARYLYAKDKTEKHKIYLLEALMLNEEYITLFNNIDKPYSPFEESLFLLAFEGLAKKSGTFAINRYKDDFIMLIDEIMSRGNTLVGQKRMIGYICSNVGMVDRSKKIFKILAKYGNFASGDVQQLIYLWGERPGYVFVKWCRERAIKSFGVEKRSWLDYLNMIGDTSFVITHCEQFEKVPMSIIDQYLSALFTGNHLVKFAEKSFLLKVVDIESLRMAQKVQLVILFKDSEQDKRAAGVFKMLSKSAIFNLEPFDVADLFVMTDQAKLGFDMIEKRKKDKLTRESAQLEYLYLSSASGLLDNLDALDTFENRSQLEQFYYLAFKFGHSKTAIRVAKRLIEIESTPVNKMMHADAMILGEHYNDAIVALGDLVDNDIRANMIFLTALGGMAGKGDKGAVMKYIERFKRGAERVLSFPGLQTDQKRSIGYLYSEIDDIGNAKKLFYEIAENAPPESTDIEQLIYLLTIKSTAKDIDWLEKRARNSSGRNQLLWCRYLNELGHSEIVINIIEGVI